jgi:hypothetical protein
LIIRIDADELFEFVQADYANFLNSSFGLAQLELPFMVTPQLHRAGRNNVGIAQQAAFFKKKQISAAEHCSYLWLVLTDAERASLPPPDWSKCYPRPVVKAAHLTQFRTPRTSVNRARFYTLQYMRSAQRIPWFGAVTQSEILPTLERTVGIGNFNSYLFGNRIVNGFADMGDCSLRDVSFSASISNRIRHYYTSYKAAISQAPRFLGRDQVSINGQPIFIDVDIARESNIVVEFDKKLANAKTEVEFISSSQLENIHNNKLDVENGIEENVLSVDLTKIPTDSEIYQAFVIVYPYFEGSHLYSTILN